MNRDIAKWNLPRRIAFRAALIYVALYWFPWPLTIVPRLSGEVAPLWDSVEAAVVVAFARFGLGIESLALGFNGSGDRAYDWVRTLLFLVLSLLGAGVWSAIDHRPRAHDTLARWLRVYLRLALGAVMLDYGMSKVLQHQFPLPSPLRLAQAYGDSSPMGLLWTFMGYSRAYNIFTGGAEMLGGLLLLFRRTTTIGALISAGVLVNVVMLNFCFDVPVKLFSAHLLLFALALAAPDAEKLLALVKVPPLTVPRPQRVGVGCVVLLCLWASKPHEHSQEPLPAEAAGLWRVEGESALTWQRVAVNRWGGATTISNTSGKTRYTKYWAQTPDDGGHSLALTAADTRGDGGQLSWALLDGGLQLEGDLGGEDVRVTLARVPDGDWLLMSRGFHWVSEAPYNR